MTPLLLPPLALAALLDGKSRTIPNWCCILTALCALNLLPGRVLPALLGALGLGGLLLLPALRTDGIGGGDIKLSAALGLATGLVLGLEVLLLAFSLLCLIGWIFRAKSLPFAPFLFTAYLLTLLLIRS